MTQFDYLTLKFDGSCRPNPGEGGSGYAFFDEHNELVLEGRYYVGPNATNNVAEYFGLIAGLRRLWETDHFIDDLYIEGDSELVINQLNGNYKVTSPRLKNLRRIALQTLAHGFGRYFQMYTISWIDRRSNYDADRLANDARIEKTNRSYDYYAHV